MTLASSSGPVGRPETAMTSHAPRIDAYIARPAEFTRPILEELPADLGEVMRGICLQ